jgi:hypothetical protein
MKGQSTVDPTIEGRLHMLRAETQTLLNLIEAFGTEVGHTSLQGLPIRQWFFVRMISQVEQHLRAIHKHDPANAAKLETELRPFLDSLREEIV